MVGLRYVRHIDEIDIDLGVQFLSPKAVDSQKSVYCHQTSGAKGIKIYPQLRIVRDKRKPLFLAACYCGAKKE